MENSRSIVVRAWRSRHIEIAEKPDDIEYHYTGQDQYIGSMVAYPVIDQNATNVIGVICLCADLAGFFTEQDKQTHKDYIGEFAIRIGLELARLNVNKR